jgi:hypothetical protein
MFNSWFVDDNTNEMMALTLLTLRRGLVNTYGTYSSYYMQNLLPGLDLLLLNLVGSTESGIVLALSCIVGRLLDAGHIRKLLIIGTVFIAAGSFGLSGVNKEGNYGEGNYGLIWLTQGLLTGLGMACFFVSSSQGNQPSEKPHAQDISLTHLHQLWQHGSRKGKALRSASSPPVPALLDYSIR